MPKLSKKKRSANAVRLAEAQKQKRNAVANPPEKPQEKAPPEKPGGNLVLFGERRPPRTVALVDYENWFYSMLNMYGIRPNIQGFFEQLTKENELVEFSFFGDFSPEIIEGEFYRIRQFTNSVIDTRPPKHKQPEKNSADFVLLDQIYQLCVRHSDIKQLILVSGDGHFTSAVNFLRTYLHIDVTVYGVRGCVDGNLKRSATKAVLMPDTFDYLLPLAKELLKSMQATAKSKPWFYFTFMKLVEEVNRSCNVSTQALSDALELLITEGYCKRESKFYDGEEHNVITPFFDRAIAADLLESTEPIRGISLAKSQRDFVRNGYDWPVNEPLPEVMRQYLRDTSAVMV